VDIESGSRDQAARKSRSQRGVVDQRTASRLDQNRGRLHAGLRLSVSAGATIEPASATVAGRDPWHFLLPCAGFVMSGRRSLIKGQFRRSSAFLRGEYNPPALMLSADPLPLSEQLA